MHLNMRKVNGGALQRNPKPASLSTTDF